MSKRIAITGIGLATPVGTGVKRYWQNLTSGRSGIRPITSFDTTGFATTIGGEVRDLDLDADIPRDLRRKMSRASQLAVVAAKRAHEDSGLEITDENRHEIDVFMGVATPDMDTLAKNMIRRHEKGARRVNPMMPAVAVSTAPTGNVVITLGIEGESITISTGCSSSTNAIGQAFRKIQYGAGKVVFAGGVDVGVQADLIAAYSNGKSLSTRNCDPEGACRPFEASRDGQVLSEAAGIILLEEYDHARKRNAKIYAEIVGYGTSTDAYSMTEVCPDTKQAERCLTRALADTGRGRLPDYYCAHGSAVRSTDMRETRTLKRIFGRQAYSFPVSSIKSMTGHPFGASGVLQTATCALAIKTNTVPPTINYDKPDPDCDLDYTPNEARNRRINTALAYSLGMGGNNASLTMSAC